MWTLIFNILIVGLTIVVLLLFVVLMVLLASLFVPIALKIDTTKKLYLLSYPGGKANYTELNGMKGIEYSFLWTKGFKSFRELIIKKKKKKDKKAEDEDDIEKKIEKAAEKFEDAEAKEKDKKKKKSTHWKYYIAVLKSEKILVKNVLNSLMLFLGDLFKLIELKNLDGTFSIPDPYYNGLCCAVLAPLTRKNFSLMPNFDGNFHLVSEMLIMPSKVTWRFLRLLFSLPVVKIYHLYRKLESGKDTENREPAKLETQRSGDL